MDLKECRTKIDEIDREIVELLEKRMEVVEQVSQYKIQKGLPVFDAGREEAKLVEIAKISSVDKAPYNKKVFTKIMETSREYQQDQRIGHGQYQYGLLGRKLGHSFSPEIHKLLGGYEYGLFQVEPENLDEFFEKCQFKGINVTTPHKKAVLKYCQNLSKEAEGTGSVNTILRNEDGTFTGHNTDYYGFQKLLEDALQKASHIKKEKALILGRGGVSPVVRAVLQDQGWRNVVTISRQGEDNYDNLVKHQDADIIVNATPVGMYPDNQGTLVNLDDFPGCKVVLDLIYNPLRTNLILQGRERGIVAEGGLKMLIYQAQKAVSFFTGQVVSDEEAEEVLKAIEYKTQNVALIGMPGCGKTTMGQAMAKALGKKFVDTDEEIYREFGMTPEEILKDQGEAAFRKMESQVLAKICKEKGQVIATGGGAVTVKGNKALLKQNSLVIYLKRPLEKLSLEGRPLSQERSVKELFKERQQLYLQWSDYQLGEE